MKRFMSKKFVISIFALAFVGSQLNAECCFFNDRCCGEPLFDDTFDIQIQAGVAPIHWHNRGEFDAAIPTTFPTAPVRKALDFPQFKSMFHLPWTVGFQVGCSNTCYTRLYAEFNYTQAQGKRRSFLLLPNVDSMGLSVELDTANYRLYDFHLGGRWYSDRWFCNTVSFFAGAKVGVTHHARTNFGVAALDGVTIIFFTKQDKIPLFKRSTSVSGGLNAGFDFCLGRHFSLVLTAEVVASCGPKVNANIPVNVPPATVTNFLFTCIGTELRFPVTVGLRYNF